MGHPQRDRVTIDLRGLREPLETMAFARQMTTAALVREALLAFLAPAPDDDEPDQNLVALERDTHLIKVTLRLPSGHAFLMTMRARQAHVSKSAYVAALIEGAPLVQQASNHAQTVSTLLASTDRLAVIGTDISAFLRVMHTVKPGASQELERYRAGIMTLNDDIRCHLTVAAQLVAELRATRRPR